MNHSDMGFINHLFLVVAISATFTVIWGATLETNADTISELQIPQGIVQGKILRSREGRPFSGFMGIPFAQNPERFQPAKLPPPTWEGTYDATNYRAKCLQFNLTTEQAEGSEDCLFINVFTPNTNGNFSVLAFIHGGGFQWGLASENGPEFLMDHDIVFVTFTYRLAALGFLSTGDEILPGNLGLFDQNFALKWIQENINYFGGDKDRVTLSGESAGSSSVSLHILSPLSRGLFRHAITESGSALDRWSILEKPKPLAENLASRLNCSTSSSKEIIDCLKEKPGSDIVDVTLRTDPSEPEMHYRPVLEPHGGVSVDPPFLTEHPRILYNQGRFSQVPLMITVNDVEGVADSIGVLRSQRMIDAFNQNWTSTAATAFLYNTDGYSNESIYYATQKLREFYFGSKPVGNETLLNLIDIYTDDLFAQRSRQTAILHSKHAPVYTALLGFKGIWSQTFLMGFEEILGMAHADDLHYLYTDYRYPPLPVGSESEAFSKLMVQLWVNFANTGDPNYELRGEKWLPVNLEEGEDITWLYLKNEAEFLMEPWKERMMLWDHIDHVLETGIIPGGEDGLLIN